MAPKPKTIYKIHPAIGIARVGSADADSYFIGPETPGLPATGEAPGTKIPPYKDGGKIKRQAARFRIWEYELNAKGKYAPTREVMIGDKDVHSIEWTVHLANRKASFHQFDGEAGELSGGVPAKPRRNPGVDKKKLDIDPGSRSISGAGKKGVEFKKGTSADPSKETWPDPPTTPLIDYLGELRTDDKGRLIVIGGKGISATNAGASIGDYANNDQWFDDVSDGPVTAQVTMIINKKKVRFDAAGAWAVVAPPDFAPQIGNVIRLYDTLFDLAARELTLPTDNALYDPGAPLHPLKLVNVEFKLKGRSLLVDYKPEFNQDIYPILRNASDMIWVYEEATTHHTYIGTQPSVWPILSNATSAAAGLRNTIMEHIRPPAGVSVPLLSTMNMPVLLGDEPYNPAHPRFRLYLTRTQYGMLHRWQTGNFTVSGTVPPPPPAAPTITPDGLDRAALENCVGGAFYPGIEVGWQIRHAGLYSEPFRINHKAKSTYYGEASKTIGPGHFSRQMALPWQADFRDCRTETYAGSDVGWWPGQRPDVAYEKASDVPTYTTVSWYRPSVDWPIGDGGNKKIPSFEEMVKHWDKFGFVLRDGANFLEKERASTIP